jgi:hypothetical protein
MDGKFDDDQSFEADGTVLSVGGVLNNAVGLDVSVDVVVAQEKAQAQGTVKNEALGKRWSGKIAVVDPDSALKPGPAIAYATAVAMENGGITTYQWHGFVNLKSA